MLMKIEDALAVASTAISERLSQLGKIKRGLATDYFGWKTSRTTENNARRRIFEAQYSLDI